MDDVKRDIATIECDVLVVGGGVAATSAAVHALEQGVNVCLAVKGGLGVVGQRGAGASCCGSTFSGTPRIPGPFREGAYDPDEQFRKVVAAGMGMADRKLARALVDGAQSMGETVKRWGIVWHRKGPVALGYPVVGSLEARLRIPEVKLLENTMIVDLLRHDGVCVGAVGVQATGGTVVIRCPSVVLATGGDAELYRYNVHPSCATGDGYAMALRAGASLMNMEFMQIFFTTVYPTRNLVHVWKGNELGEIENADGRRFLPDYLPEGITVEECVEENLRHAPFSTRDRASRYLGIAIVKEIQAGRGTEHGGVLLKLPEEYDPMDREQNDFFRFKGIDHTAGPVEMTMGHQCSNGGLRIGPDAMSAVPGLFAAGEATTGMHGADRLGGNMLANCLIFGAIAGRSAARWAGTRTVPPAREVRAIAGAPMEEISAFSSRRGKTPVEELRRELQTSGWNHGLAVRSEKSLNQMLSDLDVLKAAVPGSLAVDDADDLVGALELRNLLLVGEAVARAALERRESRGGHYREDYPEQEKGKTPEAIVVNRNDGGLLSIRSEIVDPEWTEEESDLGKGRWG